MTKLEQVTELILTNEMQNKQLLMDVWKLYPPVNAGILSVIIDDKQMITSTLLIGYSCFHKSAHNETSLAVIVANEDIPTLKYIISSHKDLLHNNALITEIALMTANAEIIHLLEQTGCEFHDIKLERIVRQMARCVGAYDLTNKSMYMHHVTDLVTICDYATNQGYMDVTCNRVFDCEITRETIVPIIRDYLNAISKSYSYYRTFIWPHEMMENALETEPDTAKSVAEDLVKYIVAPDTLKLMIWKHKTACQRKIGYELINLLTKTGNNMLALWVVEVLEYSLDSLLWRKMNSSEFLRILLDYFNTDLQQSIVEYYVKKWLGHPKYCRDVINYVIAKYHVKLSRDYMKKRFTYPYSKNVLRSVDTLAEIWKSQFDNIDEFTAWMGIYDYPLMSLIVKHVIRDEPERYNEYMKNEYFKRASIQLDQSRILYSPMNGELKHESNDA